VAATRENAEPSGVPDGEGRVKQSPEPIPVWGPAKHGVSRRAAWLLLLLILAWSVLWRVVFFHGWASSDDGCYHMCATQLRMGQQYHDSEGPMLDNRSARVSFVAATSLWMALFGGSERAVCSLDVVAGVAGILALYWVASIVAGRRAALWATLLYSVHPVDLVFNGMLFPDHFALAGMLLTMGCYFKGLTSRSYARWFWMLLGGAGLAAAVSAKETALVLGLILPLAGFCRCRLRQLGIGAAISLIGLFVFMAELPVHKATTGDWLYRLHSAQASFAPGGISHQTWSPSRYFFYPATLAVRQDVSGIFGWLLIAALLWAIARWRRYSFVVAWTLAVWLFLELAPSSLETYRPLPRDLRFMGAMTVLLFIPLGELVMILFRYACRARWVVGAVLIGVVFNGVFTANQYAQPIYWADHHRAFRAAIAMYDQGECPPLAVPDTLFDTLYFADRVAFADVKRVELSGRTRDLETAEAMLRPARGHSLVIPKRLFLLMKIEKWHGKVTPAEYTAYLDENARPIPLYDRPPPLDRLLTPFGMPRLSPKRLLGHIYLLPD